MVKIKKQLVSNSIRNQVTYSGVNGKKSITVHQTGNTSKGANAQVHANLQANGNSRTASWHWQVDDKIAIQSFPHTAQCFHAGDGRGNGNLHSIGIELCINSDGNYNKMIENGAKLVTKIMKDENIPLSQVVQHNHWSGKDCPAQIRAGKNGITWSKFKDMVREAHNGKSVSTPKPNKPSPAKPQATGGSVVDYMNKKGMDSSFGNRKKLAKQYGVKNYKGTASQNISLLNKLKGGKPKSKKSISTMANEVLAGKHGTGHANRRRSLNISQSKYNKVRAEVNRLSGVKTKPRQSIEQMANRIINDPKAPNGHSARRKWLGIGNATYQKVRARVNQKLS